MPYAIEMFFDPESESKIRFLQDSLASAGVAAAPDPASRPHVSLTVCDSVDIPAACHFLDQFAEATPSFPISLSSLGFFATVEPVAYLSPKVTPALLALHAEFSAAFAGISKGLWDHYSPARWMPHCTIATSIPAHGSPAILDICRSASLPLDCLVSAIGLVEFRPVTHLHMVPLPLAEADTP